MRVPTQVCFEQKGKPYLFCFAYTDLSSQLMCKSSSSVNLQTGGNTKISATHPSSLISSHLQIPFVCQLTNLSQNQNVCSHQYALTNALLSAKRTIYLNKICSAQSLLDSVQKLVFAVFYQCPRVGAELFKSLKNLSSVHMLNYQLYIPRTSRKG